MLFLCGLYSCLTPHTHIVPLVRLFMIKCIFLPNIGIVHVLFNEQLDHIGTRNCKEFCEKRGAASGKNCLHSVEVLLS